MAVKGREGVRKLISNIGAYECAIEINLVEIFIRSGFSRKVLTFAAKRARAQHGSEG